jgi:hypothetical protein
LEHRGFCGEEEISGEVGAVDVVLAEDGVGFGDADELDFGMLREAVEEALDVAMDQADYGYADGCLALGWGFDGGGEDCGEEEEFWEGLGESHGLLVSVTLARWGEAYPRG